MKRIILILLILGISRESFSSGSTGANYMPLQVGNIWVYNCTSYGMACSCNMIYRFQIVSSVILNGNKYFIFQTNTFTGGGCLNGCVSASIYDSLRVDSLSGNVYKYSMAGCSNSPFEKLQDSLNCSLGDTVKNNCGVSQYKYICVDTTSETIFGISRRIKRFNETQFESGYGRSYAEGLGVIQSGYGSIVCTNNSTLKGCLINGVLYGDTNSLVGINQLSLEFPQKFSLSQNYPNPFNPTTNIKFDISKAGFVKLTVYDVLGKEIQTLVNEQLSAGTYNYDFDASNLPSGIYYYKLGSGDFTQTKKMVLIK